jgi:hypothetical protein
MSEIIIKVKNGFLVPAECLARKFTHRRSFSDTHLSVEADPAIYCITEQQEEQVVDIPEPAPPGFQRMDSCMSTMSVMSTALTIESYITGDKMSVTKATAPSLSRTSSFSQGDDIFDLPHFRTSCSFSNSLSCSDIDLCPSDKDSPCSGCDTFTITTHTGGSEKSPRSVPSPQSSRHSLSEMDRSCVEQIYAERCFIADFTENTEYVPIKDVAEDVEEDERTTLMLRNIPCRYEQQELMVELVELKLPFNFLYLPPARHSLGNLGYAFVNFTKPEYAADFLKNHGNHFWRFQSTGKVRDYGEPCYATLQGFDANVKYYSKMKIARSKKRRPYVNYDM